MPTNKEVVLNTVVVPDDEEEELGTGTAPALPNISSLPSGRGSRPASSSSHQKKNNSDDNDDDDEAEDEFALNIAYVPRSQRGKGKEVSGFFSSTSSRTTTFSSAVHTKSSATPQDDGTVALDAYPSGFPDDTDKPNDTEEWRQWQERQKLRSQLPQFALFRQ